MSEILPEDIDIDISPICQWCGKECDKKEFVWTGDNESYKGWELWCYCDACKTDTFHKLKKYAECRLEGIGNVETKNIYG